ncbi:hypothetical protein, partial [Halobiforma nitratireducens]
MSGQRRNGIACDGCDRAVPVEETTMVQMPGSDPVVCCPACAEHAKAVSERADGDGATVGAETATGYADSGFGSGSGPASRSARSSRSGRSSHTDESNGSVDGAATGSPRSETTASAASGSPTETATADSRATEPGSMDIDHQRSTCDGCAQSVPDSDLETLVVTDGTTLTCCRSCAREAAKRDDVVRPAGERESKSASSSDTASRSATRSGSGSDTHSDTDSDSSHGHSRSDTASSRRSSARSSARD